jgi:hypothetical protein
MAANQRPVFALKPVTPTVNISTANTSNAVVASPSDAADFRQLYDCTCVDGAKITTIAVQFIGTGTSGTGIVNLWVTDTSGADARVRRMITIPAASGAISATLAGQYIETIFLDFQIAFGQKIFVSLTALAANTTLNVAASIGEFS